ncbi:hypothetical protein ACFE04_024183 [Oxalis oulophora]
MTITTFQKSHTFLHPNNALKLNIPTSMFDCYKQQSIKLLHYATKFWNLYLINKSDKANVIEAKELDRVDVDQYLILVRHWLSNKGKQSSETNKANVSNYKDPHCLGSKPFYRITIEFAQKNKRIMPSRGRI